MSTKNFITRCVKLPLLRKGRTPILALGLVLATVATAPAKDLCLSIPNFFGQAPLVGKGFQVPPKNKCKPFNGFTQGSFSSFVAGAGCTSADGFAFHLSFTAHNTVSGDTITGYCGFILPGLGAGSCVGTEAIAALLADELFSTSSAASGQPCTVNVP
jgi:hypothetical protein